MWTDDPSHADSHRAFGPRWRVSSRPVAGSSRAMVRVSTCLTVTAAHGPLPSSPRRVLRTPLQLIAVTNRQPRPRPRPAEPSATLAADGLSWPRRGIVAGAL